MKSPIPIELLDMAMRFGGDIELDEGRLIIQTDVLPERLLADIEQALIEYMSQFDDADVDPGSADDSDATRH